MITSIEKEVEDSIATVITTAGVSGVNIYTSERTTGRILPNVSIVVKINSEEIAPFTGIFDLTATITYNARADVTSDIDYDSKFFEIQQAFYTDPDIATQMTSASSSLLFYIANISRIGQRIVSKTRTWAKDIFMDVKVTAK